MDARLPTDKQTMNNIEHWIERLAQAAQEPDQSYWDRAFRIHEEQKSRTIRVPTTSRPESGTGRYWMLKTSEGPQGPSHWEDFKAEGVVAIG